MLLNSGVQISALRETTPGAGVSERVVTIQADSALATLTVSSISGSLTVQVLAVAGGQEVPVIEFDTQTAPTTELLIERAGNQLPSTLLVRATYTGVCSYEVQIRATDSGAGGGGGDTASASAFTILDLLTVEDTAIVQTDATAVVVTRESDTGNHSLTVRAGSQIEYK